MRKRERGGESIETTSHNWTSRPTRTTAPRTRTVSEKNERKKKRERERERTTTPEHNKHLKSKIEE